MAGTSMVKRRIAREQDNTQRTFTSPAPPARPRGKGMRGTTMQQPDDNQMLRQGFQKVGK